MDSHIDKSKINDLINNMHYHSFDAPAAIKYYELFHQRRGLSCDSVPITSFLWAKVLESEYCLPNDRCLLMRDVDYGTDRDGVGSHIISAVGSMPYCSEEDLVFYFRLQEEYFNTVLGVPLTIYHADPVSVEILQTAKVLDRYDVEEDPNIYDYIYSSRQLQTLAGRKFAKKRNHVNAFMKQYRNRYQYRRITTADAPLVEEFMQKWSDSKLQRDTKAYEADPAQGLNLAREFDTAQTLEIDEAGVMSIMNNPGFMKVVKAGGIFIDGVLSAFTIGCYNPREEMVVIPIEKAFADIDGLYQIINRDFLVNEYPDSIYVNREDDLGMENLRAAKLSYRPIGFDKKYNLKQKV